MIGEFLIYGVTGYTGELIARAVIEKGLQRPPILAGRNAGAVESLAEKLNVPFRVFGLDKPADILAGLADVKVVLNCAGPFSPTAGPFIDACLEAKAHYLDINGEVDVMERIRARDAEAVSRGIMLMPGVGFDVVPSDLLAAHVKNRLETANRLSMAVKVEGDIGRGTIATIVEQIPKGAYIRRNGQLKKVPMAWKVREFPIGEGYVRAATFPLGDLTTAFHTTGIPNIDTLVVLPLPLILAMKAGAPFMPLLGFPVAKDLVDGWIATVPPGPSAHSRAIGRATFWAEASDEDGRRVLSTLETPDGYAVTVAAAVALAERMTQGQGMATPGFQTVGRIYSPHVILDWALGARRTDVF
jgi:short subunit dehydrogenase-like uncharacterized protein